MGNIIKQRAIDINMRNSYALGLGFWCANEYHGALVGRDAQSNPGWTYVAYSRSANRITGYYNVAQGKLKSTDDDGQVWNTDIYSLHDRNTDYGGIPMSLIWAIETGYWIFTGTYESAISEISLKTYDGNGNAESYYGYNVGDHNPVGFAFENGKMITCGNNDDHTNIFFLDSEEANDWPTVIPVNLYKTSNGGKVYLEEGGEISTEGEFKTKFDVCHDFADDYDFQVIVDSDEDLQFIAWNVSNDSFAGPYEINGSGGIYDPGVDIDGNETICAVWAGEGGSRYCYGLSTDGGENWTTYTPPSSQFIGPAGDTWYSPSVLGLEDGFMLGGTFRDSDSSGNVYIGKLSTDDGNNYTFDGWNKANSRDVNPICAMSFCDYYDPNTKMNLERDGDIKFIYLEGIPTDTEGDEDVSNILWMEPLSNNAYPYDVATTGNFDDMSDFYSDGHIGSYTTKYSNAFDTAGTQVSILKYEPVEDANLMGRGAYEDPDKYYTDVLIDPETYESLPKEIGDASQWDTAVERDIRTVYFRPDFYMNRNYLFNSAGYARRTVWTLKYYGREYEITQLIPYLINDQICFWRANLFVINSEHDPFKDPISQSET